ncbi:TonB-dependent receptor [Stenotrophomonas maltophilia]|uniref:TonB-dependent receptor n=1 Tax=Stenotrophomonas maltophilia TaxID=40324 RepID=UPI0009A1D75F|nr:TonB-dependent siderophore receptor [Stenotrophomonas maltophilia]
MTPDVRCHAPLSCLRAGRATPLLLALGGVLILPAPSVLAQAIAAAADRAPQVSTLDSVNVHERRTVTDPYAGGQVASGGRVGLLGNRDFMDTPFNTISYTEAYIADRQARDITSVIAAADPTVFTNNASGAWSENYAIRGFASSTTDMTVDGLFGMAPFYRTSPEMFERIDVLKGPSALLNGMPPGGSVGGTINLIPKRAADTPLTRLSVDHGADAQFGGHVDVGRRFGNRNQWGVRVNGVHREGEGAIRHQDKAYQLGSLALDWRGERSRASLDLYAAEDLIHGPTRGVSLDVGVAVPKPPRADVLINPEWGRVESRDKGAILRGEVDFNDHLMGYAAFGASETDYSYNGAISALVLNDAGDFRTTVAQLAFNTRKQSADVGVRGSFRTGPVSHQLAANATAYQHKQDDYGRRSVPEASWVTNLYAPTWNEAPPFITPHIMHTEVKLRSVGVADTLGFADDRVQVTLGVRRQQVQSDAFDINTGALSSRYKQSATTPAAAVLFKLGGKVSLYANSIEGLSQGATAPTTAANAGEVFPPFKTRQKELGLKLDAGRFAHSFSLFEIKRPNGYTDPVSNIYSFGGEQRNRGADWSFFGSPLDGVRLMGGVAYVQPKLTRTQSGINEGKLATGLPKVQGKITAEWDLPMLEGLSLNAGITSMSRQFISADNTQWVAGHTVYDLGARYATRLSARPLTLRGTINNLTNTAYWGQPLLSSLALGAPRTFTVSATVDF